ncbi:hypothetical protein ACHHV8_23870 [Paenibacillus sp. TAB 01]|uniref:hypothetical protein n=1 Tax=Paenibacillus sp. TAB 01 TaxID=3368988 RepID=UPI003750481A
MMDSKQKTEREITYKVGWKRGKISQKAEKLPLEEPEPDGDKETILRKSAAFRWNEQWLWREARGPTGRVLKPLLVAFPVAAFGLSLWLVYQLSLQP